MFAICLYHFNKYISYKFNHILLPVPVCTATVFVFPVMFDEETAHSILYVRIEATHRRKQPIHVDLTSVCVCPTKTCKAHKRHAPKLRKRVNFSRCYEQKTKFVAQAPNGWREISVCSRHSRNRNSNACYQNRAKICDHEFRTFSHFLSAAWRFHRSTFLVNNRWH